MVKRIDFQIGVAAAIVVVGITGLWISADAISVNIPFDPDAIKQAAIAHYQSVIDRYDPNSTPEDQQLYLDELQTLTDLYSNSTPGTEHEADYLPLIQQAEEIIAEITNIPDDDDNDPPVPPEFVHLTDADGNIIFELDKGSFQFELERWDCTLASKNDDSLWVDCNRSEMTN